MKKILKWGGILLGGILGMVIILTGALFTLGTLKINRTFEVTPAAVTIPTDTASIERGAYAYATYCAGCHGDDASGTEFFADPSLATVHAPNLTAGEGGIGAFYSDNDYVRAIRHGVRPNGEGLAIMPAQAFWYFSDEELGAIIAYLKTAPPIDRTWEAKTATPLGRILIGAGVLDLYAAEHLDHSARPAAPEQGVTVEYGEHLVNTGDCRLCHGENLSGGSGPEPDAPPGPNLTPGGDLAGWNTEDFINTLRTGVTPGGRALDPHFMPWREIGRLNDSDLTAIFLYLQSLSALQTTTE